MLEAIYGPITMSLFGVLLGVMIALADMLRPRQPRERRRENESYLEYLKRASTENARWGRNVPRSYALFLLSFYAVIAMLVLAVAFSPLRLNWLVFLPALFAGFVALKALVNLARRGKLHAVGRSLLDISSDDTAVQ